MLILRGSYRYLRKMNSICQKEVKNSRFWLICGGRNNGKVIWNKRATYLMFNKQKWNQITWCLPFYSHLISHFKIFQAFISYHSAKSQFSGICDLTWPLRILKKVQTEPIKLQIFATNRLKGVPKPKNWWFRWYSTTQSRPN